MASEATKQTHGVRRRLGAARALGQRLPQGATSCPKSNAVLLMDDTPGQLRDSISGRERDAHTAIEEGIESS